jgi:arylformamidase
LERLKSIETGGSSNVSRLALSVHAGTHVDAPVHFIPGAAGVETLPLDVLMGRALVLDLPGANPITAAALERARLPRRTRRLLIKTRNSAFWRRKETEFRTDFVALDAEAARWLVDRKIALVGVDYLSVAPWGAGAPTHQILLQAGVVIVEGLDLSGIKPGRYDFICLPLKLLGSDGAPARAVLIER